MPQGKFLYYSVNPKLAYQIGLRFFDGKFRVYCAEAYDSTSTNPPQSNPAFLYQYYQRIVMGGILDDGKITSVKNALKQTARRKWRAGDLSEGDYRELAREIYLATAADFSPMLYLILREPVQNKARQVNHPGSIEYIIDDLQQAEFEVLAI